MQITGTIKVLRDTEPVSDRFKKREIVITDSSTQYPQHISIQFTNDRCDLLNNFKEGDQVEVSINLRGREWTSPQGEIKYFNTIEGWKITNVNGVISQSDQDIRSGYSDNLPF